MKKFIIFIIVILGFAYLPSFFYIKEPVKFKLPFKVKLRNSNIGMA